MEFNKSLPLSISAKAIKSICGCIQYFNMRSDPPNSPNIKHIYSIRTYWYDGAIIKIRCYFLIRCTDLPHFIYCLPSYKYNTRTVKCGRCFLHCLMSDIILSYIYGIYCVENTFSVVGEFEHPPGYKTMGFTSDINGYMRTNFLKHCFR